MRKANISCIRNFGFAVLNFNWYIFMQLAASCIFTFNFTWQRVAFGIRRTIFLSLESRENSASITIASVNISLSKIAIIRSGLHSRMVQEMDELSKLFIPFDRSCAFTFEALRSGNELRENAFHKNFEYQFWTLKVESKSKSKSNVRLNLKPIWCQLKTTIIIIIRLKRNSSRGRRTSYILTIELNIIPFSAVEVESKEICEGQSFPEWRRILRTQKRLGYSRKK